MIVVPRFKPPAFIKKSVIVHTPTTITPAPSVEPEIRPESEKSSEDVNTTPVENGSNAVIESFKNTPPLFNATVRLLDWANSARSGMSLKVKLDIDSMEIHPFKGIKAGKTAGQRMRVLIFMEDDKNGLLFDGEAILVHWQDDCIDGMSIRIRLNNINDNIAHPCDGMSTGQEEGEKLHLICWQIDDVEMPVEKKRKPFKELNPVTQSHILSNDPRFIRFLQDRFEQLFVDAPSPLPSVEDQPKAYADVLIRHYCGVTTRAQFNGKDDVSKIALEKWKRMVEIFDKYKWGQ